MLIFLVDMWIWNINDKEFDKGIDRQRFMSKYEDKISWHTTAPVSGIVLLLCSYQESYQDPEWLLPVYEPPEDSHWW